MASFRWCTGDIFNVPSHLIVSYYISLCCRATPVVYMQKWSEYVYTSGMTAACLCSLHQLCLYMSVIFFLTICISSFLFAILYRFLSFLFKFSIFLFPFIVVVMDASSILSAAASTFHVMGHRTPSLIMYRSRALIWMCKFLGDADSKRLAVYKWSSFQQVPWHWAWIKRWCHCSGRGTDMSLCVHKSAGRFSSAVMSTCNMGSGLDWWWNLHMRLETGHFWPCLPVLSDFPVHMTSCTLSPTSHIGQRRLILNIKTSPAIVDRIYSAGN